ncbi:MAG: YSC84-related protein [Pyrinomonadaceae bacterium MAG19_C2-C3]|nr:YSC84-related protein [Pyrinomonadaceae bacterium MAG19_C2-C3]
MRHRFGRSTAGTLCAVLMLAMFAAIVPAQRRGMKNVDPDKVKEAGGEAREAAEVLREIMNVPEKAIPAELLERAEAIAVFPNVVKAAFIIGGRGGDGVISRRTPSGWTAPAFFNIGGGSFGAQIGAQSTDYVLLFMNEGALKGLLEDKFEFGGEVSVAAGPVGRTAAARTNATLDAAIFSYSRSKGLFAGASIQGAVVNPDNNLNEAIYGGMKARDILTGAKKMTTRQMPAYVRVFPQTLARYSGRTMSGMGDSDAMIQRVSYRVGDTQERMQEASFSSRRLAREVRSELLTLPYYSVFDWIEFEVDGGGVVTLRGQVTTPPDTKSTAEAYVKDVEGVTRVVNNIEVLPLSPNDRRLREALYRAIYSGPLFRYQVGSLQSIHIIVNRGRATLKGVVDSEADRNIANIRARGVSGVFEVKNELVVRNDERRSR